jgi:preprotein translocase subunit SecD
VGIEVAVRDDAVDALNPMFNACFQATKACPAASTDGKGYVAIVIDGRVVSTPAVNEADLAASPFVITGDFDNTQAKAIAAAINGG